MYSKKLLAIGCAAALSVGSTVTKAADVVIGVPNWPSVLATAHVLKAALEKNLGLDVELKKGTNQTVFAGMDSGKVHVHPEVWLPNQNNFKKKYVDSRKSVRMNPNGVAGNQNICVTKGTAKRTGITNLSDLKKPKMAKQFDTDGDGKGEMWIGEKDWASTFIEKIRAKSYGYNSTMTLLEMDGPRAMSVLDDAVKSNKNMVFFCYTPHHMFASHDLVVLKEPAHDKKQWAIVRPSDTPGWFEKSRAGVAWETAYLHIHYAASLEAKQPKAAAMLSKVKLDTNIISNMTHALEVEKQDAATFAAEWVEENSDMVNSWFQ